MPVRIPMPGESGGQPPRSGKTSRGGGHRPPKKDCCPMVAALHSVKRGKFRLARRYAAMSVRLIVAGA